MKCRIVGAVLLAGLVLLGVRDTRAGDPKIKPTVNFARTWDAAVAEAKELNLPIVVHSHGFY